MRFLIDQDVYAVTTRFLRSLGHDVVSAAERGLSRADDSELLYHARVDRRIFVTRDRDFGRLVFVQDMGIGVIFLRMLPSNASAVHKELERALGSYSEEELLQVFLDLLCGAPHKRSSVANAVMWRSRVFRRGTKPSML